MQELSSREAQDISGGSTLATSPRHVQFAPLRIDLGKPKVPTDPRLVQLPVPAALD